MTLKIETSNQGSVIYWSVQLQGLTSKHLISSSCSFKSSDRAFFVYSKKTSGSIREIDCGTGETETYFPSFQEDLLFFRLTTSLYKGEPRGQKENIICTSLNSELIGERKICHHSSASIESRLMVGSLGRKKCMCQRLILN